MGTTKNSDVKTETFGELIRKIDAGLSQSERLQKVEEKLTNENARLRGIIELYSVKFTELEAGIQRLKEYASPITSMPVFLLRGDRNFVRNSDSTQPATEYDVLIQNHNLRTMVMKTLDATSWMLDVVDINMDDIHSKE